ncbi:hypothetical protein [Maribellus sp. YY47]|uniref:hypothetical protein n=1 Tax=Maribellus sp. YY47 TaxID=2929486 RepID=UPI0020017A25|nr:hypothetical protein [Maribellus sp. YY47]MCK3682524.1 hypothetical protein [Maribellus sp. YY47]
MKSILASTGILALAALLTSAISIGEMPQDPPRGKKHIQLMTIDDQGNKTEVDTVLMTGQVFVWNGDTISDGKEMKWISKEGNFTFDSDMDFDFDFDADSLHQVFVNQFGKNMPMAPKMIMMRDHQKGNVIDLSDPGIISFEKKELKDGKEKITIIREKPSEEEMEINEEIMIPGAPAAPMMFHGGVPHKFKTIKVIADEDGKRIHVDEMNDDVKVIEKDGKKIVIRKMKEGGDVKVNVEVEEQKEEK